MVLVSSLTMISSGSVFGLGWPNTVWRLCEENQSQAHLYQWHLCRSFHNVRLSITGIFGFERSDLVTRQLPEPLRDEILSIEDLQGVVEKLRSDLKERKNKPDISLSDPEDE
jgi:hypothetical protein